MGHPVYNLKMLFNYMYAKKMKIAIDINYTELRL